MAQFEFNLEENIFQLHEDLITRRYVHAPYVDFCVRDPKLRHIHKACVRDRVVHQALFRILYSLFDRFFIYDSHSCRFEKGTHAAVNRLHVFARRCSHNWKGNIFILKGDVRKFFNSIDHKILLRLLSDKIRNAKTMQLVELIVQSFEVGRGKGLPLGNVTSQLFANVYLNELDQFIKRKLKEKYYIRYCDDFVIISRNASSLYDDLARMRVFLWHELGLYLHDNKVAVKKYSQGIDFLGYVDFPYFRVVRTKTKRRIMRKLEAKRCALDAGIINSKHFKNSLQSYVGILKHCNGYKIQKMIVAKYTSEL